MSQDRKTMMAAALIAAGGIAIAAAIGLLIHWNLVPRLGPDWQPALLAVLGAIVCHAPMDGSPHMVYNTRKADRDDLSGLGKVW